MYIAEAGLESHISVIEGPALRSLEELQGPFDLVFIDADKVTYDAYYEAVLPKLAATRPDRRRPLAAVRRGPALGERSPPGGSATRAFNDKVVNDPRVVCVLTTIRDGVTLIRRAAEPVIGENGRRARLPPPPLAPLGARRHR